MKESTEVNNLCLTVKNFDLEEEVPGQSIETLIRKCQRFVVVKFDSDYGSRCKGQFSSRDFDTLRSPEMWQTFSFVQDLQGDSEVWVSTFKIM